MSFKTHAYGKDLVKSMVLPPKLSEHLQLREVWCPGWKSGLKISSRVNCGRGYWCRETALPCLPGNFVHIHIGRGWNCTISKPWPSALWFCWNMKGWEASKEMLTRRPPPAYLPALSRRLSSDRFSLPPRIWWATGLSAPLFSEQSCRI